jgi:hypothetical protein
LGKSCPEVAREEELAGYVFDFCPQFGREASTFEANDV